MEVWVADGVNLVTHSAEQGEELVGTGDEGGGAGGLELFGGAETPGDAHAGHVGGLGGEDVGLAVAHVEGLVGGEVETLEGEVDHVGEGLAAHEGLLLAHGGVDEAGEEVGGELLHGGVELVADDGGADAAATALFEHG